ncbi:MAG: arsenosugar biosynthesis radical SAM (seleno)protein ArsS [Thiotrichales bacterium]
MHPTLPRLLPSDFPALRRRRVRTLQVNLGYTCNQACLHCHVNASPKRTEQMDRATAELLLDCIARHEIATLDLTGGAPELNRHFRWLVESARAQGVRVLDRCNLTILSEPGQEDLAAYLARHQVEVVASMPCYLEENVNAQRGDGVYQRSIDGLHRLNALGYGQPGSDLTLNLVFNPGGPYLPPPQAALENDYRRELRQRHGIEFNHLLSLTNMPIARFGSTLISRNEFEPYLQLLRAAHCPSNVAQVMCLDLVSVDYRGYLFDCDFNQMLDLPLQHNGTPRVHLRDWLAQNLTGAPIRTAEHCYGCTAGQGSSCGGALG